MLLLKLHIQSGMFDGSQWITGWINRLDAQCAAAHASSALSNKWWAHYPFLISHETHCASIIIFATNKHQTTRSWVKEHIFYTALPNPEEANVVLQCIKHKLKAQSVTIYPNLLLWHLSLLQQPATECLPNT
jgi:hypothetical protein